MSHLSHLEEKSHAYIKFDIGKLCPTLGNNLTCSCCGCCCCCWCCCFASNYCFFRQGCLIWLLFMKIGICENILWMLSCLCLPVAGIGAKYWRPPPWSPQKLISSNLRNWTSCGLSKVKLSKGAGLALVSLSWASVKFCQEPVWFLPDTRKSFVAQLFLAPFPLFLIRKPAISLEQLSTFIVKPCPSLLFLSANQ